MRPRLATFTALIVFAAATCTAVATTPVTYRFYGVVQKAAGSSSNTPTLGTLVPISVTVDTSYPADMQKDHVTTYSSYNGSTFISPVLAATFNGVDAHGAFDTVYVTQNANGQYGIEVLSGSPHNGLGFDLKFTTTISGVVKSDKLPNQIFPGNFQSATFSTIQNPDDEYSGAIVE